MDKLMIDEIRHLRQSLAREDALLKLSLDVDQSQTFKEGHQLFLVHLRSDALLDGQKVEATL